MNKVARSMDTWARAVRDALAGVRCTVLRPEAYFVARSGVLTLAFEGFPEGLLRIKERVEAQHPELPQENPGSQWPKCTLAALCPGRTLTADEIEQLHGITRRIDGSWLTDAPALPVRAVEVVELWDRAVERTGRHVRLPLSGMPDAGAVPADHRSQVRRVLDQWRERNPEYEEQLLLPGFRERHYRSDHQEFSLLVRPEAELPGLEEFREAVDRALPDAYAWFSEDSRHITVRTLGAPGS